MAYLITFLLGGSALQYVLLRAENAKRLAGKRDIWAEGKSEKEIEAMGDERFVSVNSIVFSRRRRVLFANKIALRPGFLYTL